MPDPITPAPAAPAPATPAPTPATPPATPAADTQPSSSDLQDIQDSEERWLTGGKAHEGDEPEPATPAPDVTPAGQVRNADGTFGPKVDAPPAPAAAPTTPAAPAAPAPAPAPTPAPVTPAAPLIDFKAIMSEVDAEVAALEFEDAPDDKGNIQKITGAKAKKDFGQILDPAYARQDLAMQKFAEKVQQILAPILAQADTQRADAHAQAVDKMIGAVVAAGESDAPALLDDPRMDAFIAENPGYRGLISTDPARVGDLAFVLAQFRAKHGIAKPSAAPAKPQPPSPAVSRRVQAATAAARGASSGTDLTPKTLQEIQDTEERWLNEERDRRGKQV